MGRTLQIPTAEAYLPFLQPSRYKGAHGGRGSMKSHTFADNLIERFVMQPDTRWVCVREIQKSLDQSVKQLLVDKIKTFGVGDNFRVMHTHIETKQDGVILFQGMQDHTVDSIKSLEGMDGCWIEEGQSVSERSLRLLRPTIRKPGSEIWASWNPASPDDPIDKLLRGANVPPDSIVIGTTYRDNPYFPDVLRKEMEWDRQTDYDVYENVWEGAYEKHSEARVFRNFRIEPFETPKDALFYVGSDWGFSVDPSTLVRSFIQTVDPATGREWPRKRLYIDYDLFQVGVEIDYLPSFFDGLVCGCKHIGEPLRGPCANPEMHGFARRWPIIADSARPETISYMRRHGYPQMEGAKKGKDSVKEGIIFLQGYDIIIHPRCLHAQKEFKHYCYVVDKQTGKVTNVLEDKRNHIIDPLRYAVEQIRHAVKVHKAQWG